MPAGFTSESADAKLTLSFWPWSLLAQPAPLPERLIEGAADAIIANAVGQWGSRSDAFSPEVRDAYANALRDPNHIHAIAKNIEPPQPSTANTTR
jgi:haloacetate dehalogenase